MDIKNFPPQIQKELLTDEQIQEQGEILDTPGGRAPVRKLLDEVDHAMISPPVANRSGGPKRTRLWLPWTGCERDASIRLASKDVQRHIVAETRRLSLILWGCRDYRELLGHVSDFRGAGPYEAFINYWLGVFTADLPVFYDHLLDRKRLDYFQSESFKVLLWGMVSGFFEGYRVGAKGELIRPKGRELPDPEGAMEDFPVATEIVSAPKIMSAKER